MKTPTYLDNAATTKVRPEVLKAMLPHFSAEYGNPSSLHKYGRTAKEYIENARSEVASILGCQTKEIVFTGSGTESVNLAIFGVARKYALETKKPGHIIVSSIEHEAVIESVKALSEEGWKIDYVPVDKNGVVDTKGIQKLVQKNTALISIMYANNETGVIQPISEIGRMITGINRVRHQAKLSPIYFHTDACQAGALLDLDVQNLKVDLLTLNGSKLQGPKGVGILFKRNSVKLRPVIFGGGQEQGIRSGTENTPNIVGFATALKLATKERFKNISKLVALQKYLESEVSKKIPGTKINGPTNLSIKKSEPNFGLLKLPGTTNFSIKDIEAEALMYYLDAANFLVATGSACTTSSTDPSHVLIAMGLSPKEAKSAIRLSLGYDTTKQKLNQLISVLYKTVVLLKKTKQEI